MDISWSIFRTVKYYSILLVLVFVADNVSAKNTDTILNPSKASLSLLKATHYLLNSSNSKPDRDAVIVLNFLKHKYDINIPYPTLNVELNKSSVNSSNLIIFSKWFNDSYVLPKTVYDKYIHSLDSLFIMSLYCNSYGLSNNYLEKIDELSQDGGYHLTHACLYFQISNNNKCLFNNSEASILRQKLIMRLDSFVNVRKDHLYDTDIEAIALQSFMNVKIKQEQICSIINSQEINGGWRAFENDQNSYHHPASLGVWSLVDFMKEYKQPNVSLLENLSPTQQFCSWYLLSSIDTSIILADLKHLFEVKVPGGKKKPEFGGYFIPFNTVYNKFDSLFAVNAHFPSIQSVIKSDDSLAYLIFCLDKYNNLDNPAVQAFIRDTKDFSTDNNITSITNREILSVVYKLLQIAPLDAGGNINFSTGSDTDNLSFKKIIDIYLNSN